MTDMEFEKNLRDFDYSVFSKVKDSLLEEILQKYDAGNVKTFRGFAPIMADEILTDEELDYAVAAGNPNLKNDHSK